MKEEADQYKHYLSSIICLAELESFSEAIEFVKYSTVADITTTGQMLMDELSDTLKLSQAQCNYKLTKRESDF